jgi:hypothetical protein
MLLLRQCIRSRTPSARGRIYPAVDQPTPFVKIQVQLLALALPAVIAATLRGASAGTSVPDLAVNLRLVNGLEVFDLDLLCHDSSFVSRGMRLHYMTVMTNLAIHVCS